MAFVLLVVVVLGLLAALLYWPSPIRVVVDPPPVGEQPPDRPQAAPGQ